MASYLEVWKPEGPELVPLDGDRITIGSHDSNDVVLSADRTVSRLHAVLEVFPAGWSLRDMGSRNGTFVNGQKLAGERVLGPGDEVRIGRIRLVLRGGGHGEHTATDAAQPPPALTRRERDVLVALCRPVLSGDVFTEPASIRAVAAELVVSEAAVKQHLLNLYDKFTIYDADNRRLELANQAVRRGAVSVADLRRPPPGATP
ncbi:MAG: FHA domain-containing protein [Actinomycetota bacterium]|nr:FHA domain-containing protein [Actinomycetota bacterium]